MDLSLLLKAFNELTKQIPPLYNISIPNISQKGNKYPQIVEDKP